MSPIHPINMKSIGLKLMKIEQIKISRFFPLTVYLGYSYRSYLCAWKEIRIIRHAQMISWQEKVNFVDFKKQHSVTYSPYKYEVNRTKTHEMRVKKKVRFFFPSQYQLKVRGRQGGYFLDNSLQWEEKNELIWSALSSWNLVRLSSYL